MTSFSSLGVPEVLARALAAQGMTDAFPIQAATLPDTMKGRDVLGRGRTGSGKTLAFSLPLVARLAGLVPGTTPVRRTASRPRGLVLAPTRELASQIAAVLEPLAQAAGLRVTTIFGGVSQRPQESALRGGVDIVVACPGRLEDLMKQGVVSLGDVQITVLDEADHMADLGFLPGVKRILTATPKGGQRMLFSATLDNGVDKLVAAFLRDPLRHSVDSDRSPVSAMTHHVLTVADLADKREVIHHLASGSGRRVLFTRTKHSAKKLAKQLTTAGIPAVDLHGNLSQNARERNLEAFSTGGVKVLVATDIAARGIHVDDVGLVVHVDPPTEHKAYLHRSGRTARAGSDGEVVTLVLPEQLADVRAMTRQAGITATPTPVRPGSPVLVALVGPAAPYVAPPAPAAPPRSTGRGPSAPATSNAPGSTNGAAGQSRRRRGGRPATANVGSGSGSGSGRSGAQRSNGSGAGTTSRAAGSRDGQGAGTRQPARSSSGGGQQSRGARSGGSTQVYTSSSSGASGYSSPGSSAGASSGRSAGPRRAGRPSGAPAGDGRRSR
ncbi:DEAD/DEAH box helicase [Cellulomonas composti]|uniref:ATP-dependent RNA helicase n=1 Tax=Cellulomonas composti TaxID=266130 RepID=A0A511JAL6_9CELL|nr:DEAD/DEAH box helicase [Cellulomonas composti]GEL95027.1 hypothetical protein CCO02nite_16850 [Cellulomonas composti]